MQEQDFTRIGYCRVQLFGKGVFFVAVGLILIRMHAV